MTEIISIADGTPSIALLMNGAVPPLLTRQNVAMAKTATKKAIKAKAPPRIKQPKRRTLLPQWRKYRGSISQTDLAELSGVSQSQISQLETGRSDYSGELLEKLAAALKCEPADLISRNPLDTEAPWSIWGRLSDDKRKCALQMLKGLVAEDAT